MGITSGTLGNMSISDEAGTNLTVLMPKLKYRFRVQFTNFGKLAESVPLLNLTRQVKEFKRPEMSFADIDIDVYNSIVKMAGMGKWEDVSCTLRDDASGMVSALVGNQLQKQFDFENHASAPSGSDYKFGIKVQMLDGGNTGSGYDGSVLETWELVGCWLNNVAYGDVKYGESSPIEITMNIKFDNAQRVDEQLVPIIDADTSDTSSGAATDQGQ